MKKIVCLLFALMFCTMGLVSCSDQPQNSTQPEAGNKPELIIGYTDYAPMNYMDENGKLIGFDTEFAEAVCAKLGYTPKFQLIDWNNKYMELNSGSINCIWNGFTYNCADDDGVQRADKVDFTYAYMNNEQCVVVKKDALATLNNKDALAGKKVSAENGSAGEGAAKDLAGAKDDKASLYIGVTAQMNALTELKSNTVDFVVLDKTLAMSVVGKGDYADLAIADQIALESEQYAIGFKKGSELTAKVNEAIKALSADGTLAKLAEKYGLSNYLVTEFK